MKVNSVFASNDKFSKVCLFRKFQSICGTLGVSILRSMYKNKTNMKMNFIISIVFKSIVAYLHYWENHSFRIFFNWRKQIYQSKYSRHWIRESRCNKSVEKAKKRIRELENSSVCNVSTCFFGFPRNNTNLSI